MEAGVATSLHFPRWPPVPVKAWGFPSEGSGRSLSAPVGSLGPKRNLAVTPGSLTGVAPKSCDFAGFPVRVPSKHCCIAGSLRGSRPEGRIRRTIEESGFGLRLALLPQLPVPTPWRTILLAEFRHRRGGRDLREPLRFRRAAHRPRNSLVPCVSESRQADSFDSCLWINGILWITFAARRRRCLEASKSADCYAGTRGWRAAVTIYGVGGSGGLGGGGLPMQAANACSMAGRTPISRKVMS